MVQARLAKADEWYARSRLGGKLLGRPSFADSSYLLTGFLKCDVCCGSVITESQVHGPRGKRFTVRFYGCTTHRRSGAPACANAVTLRQDRLDGAVLSAVAALLDPEVIETAVESALARLSAGCGRQQGRRQADPA